jgi:hypothetical protein
MVFHEGMHQWDDQVQRALQDEAIRQGTTLPVDLSHVLVFVTVGEAIRRLHPEHVPYIDALNLWPGTLSGARAPAGRLRPAIQQFWEPYMNGRGTRDEVFKAILSAASATRAP